MSVYEEPSEFRREVLRRLEQLENDRNRYHHDNVQRLERLEEFSRKIQPLLDKLDPMLDEWTGDGDPDRSMRKALRIMIDEHRAVSIGWKVMLAFGTLATAIMIAWDKVSMYFNHSK